MGKSYVVKVITILVILMININIINVQAESKVLRDVKLQVANLEKSLKTNYLGMKNQKQWEKDSRRCKEQLKKVNKEEKKQVDSLINMIKKCDELINCVARINLIEGEIKVANSNQYGFIDNIEKWKKDINTIKKEINLLDKKKFKKQHLELHNRIDKVNQVIVNEESSYNISFEKIEKLWLLALKSNSLDMVEEAYQGVLKLKKCNKTFELESDIENYIYTLKGGDEEEIEVIFDELTDIDGDFLDDRVVVTGVKDLYARSLGVKVQTGSGYAYFKSVPLPGVIHVMELNRFKDSKNKQLCISLGSGGTSGGEVTYLLGINNGKLECEEQNFEDDVKVEFLDNYKVEVSSKALNLKKIHSLENLKESLEEKEAYINGIYQNKFDGLSQGPSSRIVDIDNDGIHEISQSWDIDGTCHGDGYGSVDILYKYKKNKWICVGFNSMVYNVEY